MTTDPAPRWTLVMPVKGGPSAKSRLRHPSRADLAAAFALDAVEAALGCRGVRRVVVVTADQVAAREHAELGADVVTDPGAGLGAALRAGLEAAVGATALLLADLPALRADDLEATLAGCERLLAADAGQVTVPDADGDGTVLLAAASPQQLRPRFGTGSAAAHARVAAVLRDVPPGVRRDVDTDAHLDQAVRLGVGRRTAALLGAQPRSTIAPSAASFSPKCS